MINTRGVAVSSVPTVDLNELCLDHPGAAFIFEWNSDLLIVDCVATPDERSLVMVERGPDYLMEFYSGQTIFGVITHIVRRLN